MVKNWRQPKYTFIGKQQNKQRYFPSVEHHEAIKRNETDLYISTWRELLGEGNKVVEQHTECDTLHVTVHFCEYIEHIGKETHQ